MTPGLNITHTEGAGYNCICVEPAAGLLVPNGTAADLQAILWFFIVKGYITSGDILQISYTTFVTNRYNQTI